MVAVEAVALGLVGQAIEAELDDGALGVALVLVEQLRAVHGASSFSSPNVIAAFATMMASATW